MEKRYSRVIAFKAKHVNAMSVNAHLNGTWMEGYLSSEDYIYSPELEGEFLIDKSTICQYTGLEACWIAFENEPQECDVWEHDLLEVEYEGKRVVAEVMYASGMFILASEEFEDSYIPLFEVVQMNGDCAYIDAEHKGNIFDNPELIE